MVLLFLGLQKNKPNRRAQGLCFCFFGAVRKNKSNRRAQGLYFWFLWGFQKKTNPIRGQRLKGTFAWEKQTEHMPAVRIRFLPPVRPVRELILYISGSVRFGFPTAGFWAVSGSRGSVPGSRFGSRTFLRFLEHNSDPQKGVETWNPPFFMGKTSTFQPWSPCSMTVFFSSQVKNILKP